MSHSNTIALNIKKYRKHLGLTQDTIAKYLGVSRVMIAKYESGEDNLPSHRISKLAKLFGIDEYDLYEDNPTLSSLAVAFRAEEIDVQDLRSIAEFKTIAMNYIKMKQALNLLQ